MRELWSRRAVERPVALRGWRAGAAPRRRARPRARRLASGATGDGRGERDAAHRAGISRPQAVGKLGDSVKAPVLLEPPRRRGELVRCRGFRRSAGERRLQFASWRRVGASGELASPGGGAGAQALERCRCVARGLVSRAARARLLRLACWRPSSRRSASCLSASAVRLRAPAAASASARALLAALAPARPPRRVSARLRSASASSLEGADLATRSPLELRPQSRPPRRAASSLAASWLDSSRCASTCLDRRPSRDRSLECAGRASRAPCQLVVAVASAFARAARLPRRARPSRPRLASACGDRRLRRSAVAARAAQLREVLCGRVRVLLAEQLLGPLHARLEGGLPARGESPPSAGSRRRPAVRTDLAPLGGVALEEPVELALGQHDGACEGVEVEPTSSAICCVAVSVTPPSRRGTQSLAFPPFERCGLRRRSRAARCGARRGAGPCRRSRTRTGRLRGHVPEGDDVGRSPAWPPSRGTSP